MKTARRVILLAAVSVIVGGSTLFAQVIPGRYIAVLRDGGPDPEVASRDLAGQHGLQVSHVYRHAIRGFAFAGAPQAAAALSRRGEILFVEQDQVFEAWAETIPTGINRADVPSTLTDGSGSSVDVDIAIIDTGIQQNHPDLNVVGGIRYYIQRVWLRSDGNWNDGNGHGTHVAGTAAAKNQGSGVVGVAPGARLWAVKVLDDRGSGSTTAVIAGVDWVKANAATIEVANMSLGGGYSQALNAAVANAVAAGVVMVVAAGNEATDAGTKSPASEPTAITVSALADSDGLPGGLGGPTSYGADDTFATFSNYGSVVDICAPGVDILSTYLNGGLAVASGTSMASPHVAGAAALYMASLSSRPSVSEVTAALLGNGWTGFDTYYYFKGDPDKYPEPLLNVGALFNAPPTVSITSPVDGDSFDIGESISFVGAAWDVEDGDLTAGIEWTSSLDDLIGTGESFSKVLSEGSHTITASVTDSGGAVGTTSISIYVGPPPNTAPTVSITSPGNGASFASGASIFFSGTASDLEDDNLTAELTWTSSLDDLIGTGESFWKVLSDGSHTITASVTDSGGKVGSAPITITVTSPTTGITLTATGYKVKGKQKVDLTWSGGATSVDVYRKDVPNGPIATTNNDGFYTDNINKTGSGTYTYYLMSDGVKSNEATVIFN